jgi:hypothetical protein
LVNNSGVEFNTDPPKEFAINGTGTQSVEGGGPGWGTTLGLSAGAFEPFGIGFGPAQFWYATSTNDDGSPGTADANLTRFGNSENFATFSLATDGSVVYNLAAASVGAIPLPAAFWMMGAGLLGMGSAARRRKAQAEAATA